MAQCQVEGGRSDGGAGEGGEEHFEQILPTEELLAIYRRITENEIKVGHCCPAMMSSALQASIRSNLERDNRGTPVVRLALQLMAAHGAFIECTASAGAWRG